ncbi:MAG: hypothetical protein EZS28_035417, partial [Streblomastix strix]
MGNRTQIVLNIGIKRQPQQFFGIAGNIGDNNELKRHEVTERIQYQLGNEHVSIMLSQGAYGRVYLAFHNDIGVIAAKVLRIEKFDEKEWDAAGALNKPEFQCPFVVKYLFAKQFENDVVILMSYANAKSLDVIVKNQYQFLSIPTFRALAKQLLEGLRIIHSAKLIHRDIKSENIMLHAQQGNVKAKIADFGLAKINQENQLKITSCGTPLNMAPELVNHSFYSDNK